MTRNLKWCGRRISGRRHTSTMGRSLGSAGYCADLSTAPNHESGGLSWTLHWPEQNRWLGYNMEISIETRRLKHNFPQLFERKWIRVYGNSRGSFTRPLSIDTLRLLAVDEVQKANSGHPGAPLGCAPIAYLLFHKLMKHNPANSNGRIATGLCCRTGTPRLCSMPRFSSPATR